MKAILSISIIIILIGAILGWSSHYGSADAPGETKTQADILAETFKTGDGWGYRVFVNNKLFIKQSFIPVIEGNKEFAKEEDAIKVATLVVNKIKSHQKPTIKLEELKQCGIISN